MPSVDYDSIILGGGRSEEHTSELQSRGHLVCRLLLENKYTAVSEHSPLHEKVMSRAETHAGYSAPHQHRHRDPPCVRTACTADPIATSGAGAYAGLAR